MVSGYSRWFRFLLILVLTGIFLTASYLIDKKQREKYSYNSFHVTEETAGLLIPNIDRLRKKINSAADLQLQNLPEKLIAAIDAVIQNKTFHFTEKLSQSCFISYNTSSFLFAFQTTSVSSDDLANLLQKEFSLSANSGDETLIINNDTFVVAQHNHFLVVSNCQPEIITQNKLEHFGNADFIVFEDTSGLGQHHVLNDQLHHIVWSDQVEGPKGAPILHEQFLTFVPSVFSELQFFGSSRLATDESFFFNQPEEGLFSWVDGGLILIRKDSFELLIAPQNLETDLKLKLEEETLLKRGDTSFIPYFNIGSYKVMPFETEMSWKKSISNQKDDFHFFTEIENFNVLSNSIPAMRWYLGELQLGNLLVKHKSLYNLYSGSLPQRANTFSIIYSSDKGIEFTNKIWINDSTCIVSKSISGGSTTSNQTAKLCGDFETEFVPTAIRTVRKNSETLILLSNTNQLGLYDTSGATLWYMNLSTPLTGAPQIVDLENDGQEEIALFQTDQLNILRADGTSAQGLPKKFGGISRGGIAVNYDNAFNYRFLTNIENEIKSLDEQGVAVQGWMFTNMTANLQGKISYYVTQGKDMISFKDDNNRQYVINRRGESRLTKEVFVKLPNESPFVVGNYDEASLRKLGYKNNYIYNWYLLDGQKDSVKLDREVNALVAYWIFNNNQPLLIIEESERVIVIDEFGYEKESVLKPIPNQHFGDLVIEESFKYVFIDNSDNALYLLDGFGKMIFPVPVKGSNVFHLSNGFLYTLAGNKINIYKTE